MASTASSRLLWPVVQCAGMGILVALSCQRLACTQKHVTIERQPVGVMGTASQIIAVIPSKEASRGEEILDAAEVELRRLEALTSTWIDASQLSRLNAAPIGLEITLSSEILEILSLSSRLYEETSGAFDITSGPLIERWRLAAESGTRPSEHELESARRGSSWADLEISEKGATRLRDTLRLDVDGIAKGYAIDRAVDALLRAGALGALVEVGGDLRAVGQPPDGQTWPVGVRSPFSADILGTIELEHGSVCTSGAYARPIRVGPQTVSHIIDPRTGEPVDQTASVTVVAPRTATADAWATALSVLGVEGLRLLPDGGGIEALAVVGSPERISAVATGDFPELDTPMEIHIERVR